MFDSSTGCGECSPACRPGLPFRVFGANKALHEQGFPVTYFCFNRTQVFTRTSNLSGLLGRPGEATVNTVAVRNCSLPPRPPAKLTAGV